MNRQLYHRYLAFICTHLRGITLFHVEIGVIFSFVPNYMCYFSSCGLQGRTKISFGQTQYRTCRRETDHYYIR